MIASQARSFPAVFHAGRSDWMLFAEMRLSRGIPACGRLRRLRYSTCGIWERQGANGGIRRGIGRGISNKWGRAYSTLRIAPSWCFLEVDARNDPRYELRLRENDPPQARAFAGTQALAWVPIPSLESSRFQHIPFPSWSLGTSEKEILVFPLVF